MCGSDASLERTVGRARHERRISMNQVNKAPINAIEISPAGDLLVRVRPDPRGSYQYIYRSATGIRWDQERQCFVAPKPRERSYAEWFGQVVTDAESELGVELVLGSEVMWLNIPPTMQEQILVMRNKDATYPFTARRGG